MITYLVQGRDWGWLGRLREDEEVVRADVNFGQAGDAFKSAAPIGTDLWARFPPRWSERC